MNGNSTCLLPVPIRGKLTIGTGFTALQMLTPIATGYGHIYSHICAYRLCVYNAYQNWPMCVCVHIFAHICLQLIYDAWGERNLNEDGNHRVVSSSGTSTLSP